MLRHSTHLKTSRKRKKFMSKGPIETNQMSIEADPDSMESMIALYQEKKRFQKFQQTLNKA